MLSPGKAAQLSKAQASSVGAVLSRFRARALFQFLYNSWKPSSQIRDNLLGNPVICDNMN